MPLPPMTDVAPTWTVVTRGAGPEKTVIADLEIGPNEELIFTRSNPSGKWVFTVINSRRWISVERTDN